MTGRAGVARPLLPTIDDAPGRHARFGGCLYLFIIGADLFADGVRHSLVRSGDPLGNVHAIAGSPDLWTAGVVVEFALLPCALALATIEYRLLQPVHRDLAFFALVTNLASIALEAGNATLPVLVARLTGDDSAEPAWRAVDLVLRAHAVGLDLGVALSGVGCLALGYLIFHSRFLPRPLGVAMGLAGVGHVVGAGSALFFPTIARAVLPATLVVPFVGELSFCLWLIFRGVDVAAWRRCRDAASVRLTDLSKEPLR